MSDFTDCQWAIDVLAELKTASGDSLLIPMPERATESARLFYSALMRMTALPIVLWQTAVFSDNFSTVVEKALSGESTPPPGFDPLTPLFPDAGPFRTRLNSLSELLIEMIAARHVDNFMTYLTEIIRDSLKARPELLRSAETARLDFVLGYQNMDELRSALVDRKVNELGYLGLDKLVTWMHKQLGIANLSLFPGSAVLVNALEARNCIVHNRGLVSAKYVRTVAGTKYSIGDRICLTFDDVFVVARATAGYVKHVDPVLATKFGIEERELREKPPRTEG